MPVSQKYTSGPLKTLKRNLKHLEWEQKNIWNRQVKRQNKNIV